MSGFEPDRSIEAGVEAGPQRLEAYIQAGLDLIRQGRFQDANTYFRNREVAEKLGFKLGHSTSLRIFNTPTEEEASLIADALASHSRPQGKLLFIANIMLWREDKTLGDQNLGEGITIPPSLSHNMALIAAEEWLHGLQEITGDRSLINNQHLSSIGESEVDVARYLQAHQVPMTNEFLARYGRAQALFVPPPSSPQL